MDNLDLDKIPSVVMNSLKTRFPNAEIHKWTKEKEGGNIIYDIEFKQECRKCEADIKENGIYINFEKEIAAKDLPKVVKKVMEDKYPEASIKEIMEITDVKGKEEKLEGYEVVFATTERKDAEVTVAPDGKIFEESGDE